MAEDKPGKGIEMDSTCNKTLREAIAEWDEEILLFDGFDDAVIGVYQRCSQPLVVAYDYQRCIQVLMADGLSEEEAEEHMSFNVEGGWIGDRTPAVIHPIDVMSDVVPIGCRHEAPSDPSAIATDVLDAVLEALSDDKFAICRDGNTPRSIVRSMRERVRHGGIEAMREGKGNDGSSQV